jgi:26S proteasome regulatory subunit N3
MQLQAKPSLLNPDEDVETKLHCTKARMEELTKIPEVHMFIYVMVLMKLIDDGDFKYAKEFGDFIFARMRNVNRRTMDFLAAKAYYFAAVAYEKLGLLSELRPTLFEIYKSCCLHLDQIGQATIMNILIRSFLQQNLIE